MNFLRKKRVLSLQTAAHHLNSNPTSTEEVVGLLKSSQLCPFISFLLISHFSFPKMESSQLFAWTWMSLKLKKEGAGIVLKLSSLAPHVWG